MNGAPIEQYHYLRSPVTFSYTLAYEQHEARAYAGLTLEEYDRLPGTPNWITRDNPSWSKCHIVVHYRMHRMMEAVQQDQQARAMQRSASKNRA